MRELRDAALSVLLAVPVAVVTIAGVYGVVIVLGLLLEAVR